MTEINYDMLPQTKASRTYKEARQHSHYNKKVMIELKLSIGRGVNMYTMGLGDSSNTIALSFKGLSLVWHSITYEFKESLPKVARHCQNSLVRLTNQAV